MKPITAVRNNGLRPNLASSQPVAGGDDRSRHDIGGQHPVDLVAGRRQAALHIGQRDVGNRGVERLHQGSQASRLP